MGGLDLRTLLAKALHMGDDGHNRLDAASLLYTNLLAPYIAKNAKDAAAAFEVIKFLGEKAQTTRWAVQTGYLPVRQSAKDDVIKVQIEVNPPPESL